MLRPKLIHFCLTCVFLLAFAVRCDEGENFIFPEVYLNLTINVKNDAQFIGLLSPGNSLEVLNHPNGESTLGYDNNGIIIYNNGEERSQFYAFDRTCPHDLPTSIAIMTDGNKATCPQCGSVYIFPSDGQPSSSSVSRFFLGKYKTYYNPNTGNLLIQN